ncbi:hypothetical protein M422DRAFT_275285, partial [Sphaerobolus stellatus SS14]
MSKKLKTEFHSSHGATSSTSDHARTTDSELPTMQIPQPKLHQTPSTSTPIPVLSTVGTVSVILEDVGKLVERFPYIEGIAAILRRLIRIRQEMKDAEDYCKEVIDNVVDLSSEILLEFQRIPELIGKDHNLQLYLEEYSEFLNEVHYDIERYWEAYQRWNPLVKWIYQEPETIKKLKEKTIKLKEKYEETFWNALEHHRQAHNLEEAQKSFQDALELHKQAQDVLGQAYDLQHLGELYMCQDQLEEAEKSFQGALELHKQAQSVLGQANDLQNLGELYMHRGQLEEAEKSVQDALELHKQAQDVVGQANDLQ